MDLELVCSVLEIVLDTSHKGGEFFWLANGDEAGTERVSHGGREKIATRLNSDDDIDGPATIMLVERVNRLAETLFVL
jgi:hypothetical protein